MKRFFRHAAKSMLVRLDIDVPRQLVLENEYLRAENEAFRSYFKKSRMRLRLDAGRKIELARHAKALGRRIYGLASIVRPETLLRWHRELVARKFDSSKSSRRLPGRPASEAEIEQGILRFARENKSWGYRRIAAALKNLGLCACPSTVASIMKRNGVNPSGDRKKGGMS